MSTISSTALGYAHRKNNDGTFDSICRRCFLTIASETSEPKLTDHEEVHQCEALAQEKIAASLRTLKKSSVIPFRSNP